VRIGGGQLSATESPGSANAHFSPARKQATF
jgi:hypothetical protein